MSTAKTVTHQLLACLACVLGAAVCLCGCRDDAYDGEVQAPQVRMTDFMTLVSNDDSGVVFDCQRNDAEPVMRFYSDTQRLSDKAVVGGRYVLLYAMRDAANPQQSGPIAIYSVEATSGPNIEPATETVDLGDEIRVYTLFAAGPWLNAQVQVHTGNSAGRLALYLDTATLSSGSPQMYLRLEDAPTKPGEVQLWETKYGSWDISALAAYPTLTVHANNARGPKEFVVNN